MSYPIKYAVLELKVDGGFVDHYEDVTKAFIVSKCFVLEDRLCYSSGDLPFQKYIVSFPFDRFNDFTKWFCKNRNYRFYYEEKKNPYEKSFVYGYPLYTVTELFDDYEEAKELADSKNRYLKMQELINTNYSTYIKLANDFDDMMLICSEYEKFIFENTFDMEISLDELQYSCPTNNAMFKRIIKKNK